LGGENETFQVTHPFHPLSGKVFELVTCHTNWGDEQVYYHDETGKLCSLPLKWTSLAPADPFVSLSAGRAAFRVSDLLELSRLLASLQEGKKEENDAENRPAV
jgi:Family of unknown function (DUF5372)